MDPIDFWKTLWDYRRGGMMRWYDETAVIREATLAQARKEHYYPSTTTVIDVIDKPGLNIWKQNILIEEALSLSPIFAEHEREEFNDTVRFRAALKFEEAAKLGTLWHTALTNYFMCSKSEDCPIPQETLDEVDRKMGDLGIYIEEHEIAFVNKGDGYAGTIDAIGYRVADEYKIPIVLDWKTQATNGRSPRYYESWPMQLAAYGNSCSVDWDEQITHRELWNVVLSTTNPGKVWFKRWHDEGLWLDLFFSAHTIWCALNNYNPVSGERYFRGQDH